MKTVVTNQLYSPQNFLEKLTGKCFYITGSDDIDFIHSTLLCEEIETEDIPLWDYPLEEINDGTLENTGYVVLVSCATENADGGLEEELRWFEIPEELVGRFQDN